MRVVPYAQALDETADFRRHLLLGNGFSIAASPGFQYRSLYEVAFGDEDARLREIFQHFGTTDFEQVIGRLDDARDVLHCYPEAGAISTAIHADRQLIAARLIGALAQIHPGTSRALPDAQYTGCGQFLAAMRRQGNPELSGLVFTTNYDLLLYWSTLRNWRALQTQDGFRGGPEGLVWSANEHQSVFHLHGALHMFVGPDGSVMKLRWEERPLIDQILELINRDLMPLFVTEGSSAQKLERINENSYLRAALGQFEEACQDERAVLFVFGSSLNDAHIADLIVGGNVSRVYVSSTDVEAARPGIAALEARWREHRLAAGSPEIELVLFAAEDALPWGAQ